MGDVGSTSLFRHIHTLMHVWSYMFVSEVIMTSASKSCGKQPKTLWFKVKEYLEEFETNQVI